MLAFLVIVLIVIGIAASKSAQKSEIKDGSWLVIDIYGSLDEYSPPGGVMSEIVGGKSETLQRILTNLEKVTVDDRIEGVVLKMSASNGAGRAMFEEIRGAVKKVQASGKKVIGFSDSMDRDLYYLACACDSLYMPPTGYMIFIGTAVTTDHLLGTFEKLGISQNMHRIKDYKSAAELMTRKDMSPTARENKEWMLDEYWDLFCEAVEEDRGLSEEKITEAMDAALLIPYKAVEMGLLDDTRYWDEIEDVLKGDGEKLLTVGQGRYADEKPEDLGLKGKKTIAVIHAQGFIGGRKNRVDPMLGIMMGHETIVAEFKKALKDDDVAAIVFRVNSGGGEGLASDLMGHQVEITASEKPVVVSMVDVAASGGYHIAYRATKILADKMTITGSIGSISGKMNIAGLHDKIGISHDFVTKGPNALFYSPYRDFTAEEWKLFTDDHWEGFNNWLRDVSEHRGMTFEEAEKLAHGRVYFGRQALENGLIDEVGGLDRAIEIAKELSEIPAEDNVTVAHYPVKKGFFEELVGGNFSAVAQYVVYRYIRDDLSQTWNMVVGGRNSIMEPMDIR